MTAEDTTFRQAIIEQPDDDTHRLIFADWLEERGDPRAEFIRVQCELARLPDPTERWDLLARERALLEEHAAAWRGADLGEENAKVRCEFRRGFVEAVTMSAGTFLSRAEGLFRNTPLTRIRLTEAAHATAELAACGLLSRCQALDLDTPGSDLDETGVVQVFAGPNLDNLEELRFHGRSGLAGAGALAAAASRGRKLQHLRVGGLSANEVELLGRTIDPGMLKSLAILEPHSLGRAGIEYLASARAFDSLEQLILFGMGTDLSMLRTLAATPHFSNLRSLRVTRDGMGNDGAETLARTENLRGLQELCATNCQIGRSGLRALISSRHFPELRVLGLSSNHITADCLADCRQQWRLPLPRVLRLGANAIDDAAAQILADAPFVSELQELDLSMTKLGPWGVKSLATSANLSNLRSLILAQTLINDDALRALGAFPHLRQLRALTLRSDQVSDAGIEALCESKCLQSLVELDLAVTDVTDAGFLHLLASPLGQRLRSLDVSGTTITGAGLAALASARNLNLVYFWPPESIRESDPEVRGILERRYVIPRTLTGRN